MKSDNIRVFLESPNTLEPVSELDIKKSDIRHFKKRKPVKEKLPPYVPVKSIYLETDFSKLTERQKILAIKYQSHQSQINPLFLAVNDLKDISSVSETKHKRTKDTTKTQPKMQGNKRKPKKRQKKALAVLKTGDSKNNKCRQCYTDSTELLHFLEWLEENHKCIKVEEIKTLKERLKDCLDTKECICKIEKDMFLKATEIANYSCCLD